MKRVCLIGLIFLLTLGCGKSSNSIEEIIAMRRNVLEKGCKFTASISADYTQVVLVFKMRCTCDTEGNITFEVIEPDSISGTAGTLDAGSGKFTFDDHALLFSTLADGCISPVSAPWIFMKALRSGYISGCNESAEGVKVHIDDSYQQDALRIIVETDAACKPIAAEIYHRDMRVLTIIVEDFLLL